MEGTGPRIQLRMRTSSSRATISISLRFGSIVRDRARPVARAYTTLPIPQGVCAQVASIPGNSSARTIKNMTEHKSGRYFPYSGNLYNGSYAQAQSGEVWNNSMEYGSGPGAANDHITVMNNAE